MLITVHKFRTIGNSFSSLLHVCTLEPVVVLHELVRVVLGQPVLSSPVLQSLFHVGVPQVLLQELDRRRATKSKDGHVVPICCRESTLPPRLLGLLPRTIEHDISMTKNHERN